MRFDDSLETVLAAEAATPFGARSAWRQLIDLIGRRRAPASDAVLDRLAAMRATIPVEVRAASARALAFADPPAGLVRLFAFDEPGVAAPVLIVARLSGEEWLALLPAIPPASRALLRHRRDLPDPVVRALASFGAADFALPVPDGWQDVALPEPDAPVPPPPPQADASGAFPIADLVARLAAYRDAQPERPLRSVNLAPEPPVRRFQFETDEFGTLRWVDQAPREALVGLSIGRPGGAAAVDGVVSGAFRRRQPIALGRLTIAGETGVSGEWRVSATPGFDWASGRFTGYRGTARRPRADERAEPRPPGSDALRSLVHELRTPAAAIAGLAEMIEAQVLGPADPGYRDRAAAIRRNADDLMTAIDDIDLLARLDGQTLTLRPGVIAVGPLLARVAAGLEPLMRLRRCQVDLDDGPDGLAIAADGWAVERLVQRLLATLIAAADDETLRIEVRAEGGAARIAFDRPRRFGAMDEAALLALDPTDTPAEGLPLLGAGFALRLARNLAAELGGRMTLDGERLTLRLPAAVTDRVEATT